MKNKKIDKIPSYSIGQDMLYFGIKLGDFFEKVRNQINNLLSKK